MSFVFVSVISSTDIGSSLLQFIGMKAWVREEYLQSTESSVSVSLGIVKARPCSWCLRRKRWLSSCPTGMSESSSGLWNQLLWFYVCVIWMGSFSSPARAVQLVLWLITTALVLRWGDVNWTMFQAYEVSTRYTGGLCWRVWVQTDGIRVGYFIVPVSRFQWNWEV